MGFNKKKIVHPELTHENLINAIDYNPETGIFTYKNTNQSIERKNNLGYNTIYIFGKQYFSHRLAWFYVYGKFPNIQIDHINRIKDDNRIENLRDVTQSENNKNRAPYKRNKIKKAKLLSENLQLLKFIRLLCRSKYSSNWRFCENMKELLNEALIIDEKDFEILDAMKNAIYCENVNSELGKLLRSFRKI